MSNNSTHKGEWQILENDLSNLDASTITLFTKTQNRDNLY